MARRMQVPEDVHPMIGTLCAICFTPIQGGNTVVLVPTGPASEEDEEKMKEGCAFDAYAEAAHYECYEGVLSGTF